jgi:hypothetical protein
MRLIYVLFFIGGISLSMSCTRKQSLKSYSDVSLEVVNLHPEPIIKAGDPGTEDIKFGFEGGTSHKVNGRYYIFSTEVFDEPKTAAVRLAIWESADGIKFEKQGVIAETNFDWNDSTYHMSPWSPMVVFDDSLNRWSVFFVGYRRKPNATDIWNMSGRIHRYDSKVPGVEGIKGPYIEGDWLNIDKKGDSWEGPAEIVSFYPYKVGKTWYGFYGSNSAPSYINPQSKPQSENEAKILFYVGLAKSSSLTGKWERCTKLNPVFMDPEFIENPIVTKVNDSLYLVVYDGANKNAISYSWSKDGIHWQKEKLIQLPDAPKWLNSMRTPLGLISEGNDEYSLYFTAFNGVNPKKVLPFWHDGFGNVGLVKLKLVTN